MFPGNGERKRTRDHKTRDTQAISQNGNSDVGLTGTVSYFLLNKRETLGFASAVSEEAENLMKTNDCA